MKGLPHQHKIAGRARGIEYVGHAGTVSVYTPIIRIFVESLAPLPASLTDSTESSSARLSDRLVATLLSFCTLV